MQQRPLGQTKLAIYYLGYVHHASISGVLTRIFNLSFNITMGQFHDSWKIVPLHKKGSVHDFKMCRPVSLLPCISKVFEKLFFNEVYLHLRRNGLLSEYQSGLSPGDSTINQLIHITDRILKSIDNFEDCIGCFLDLTKAFDTVWHKELNMSGCVQGLWYVYDN